MLSEELLVLGDRTKADRELGLIDDTPPQPVEPNDAEKKVLAALIEYDKEIYQRGVGLDYPLSTTSLETSIRWLADVIYRRSNTAIDALKRHDLSLLNKDWSEFYAHDLTTLRACQEAKDLQAKANRRRALLEADYYGEDVAEKKDEASHGDNTSKKDSKVAVEKTTKSDSPPHSARKSRRK